MIISRPDEIQALIDNQGFDHEDAVEILNSVDDDTRALAEYLKTDVIEAQELIDNDSWEVMTYEDAYETATEYIRESLFAFNLSFLQEHSEVLQKMDKDSYKSYVSTVCESANEFVEACIDDFDSFVEDAINTDGIGHFLNSYDGNAYDTDDFSSLELDDHYILVPQTSY